MRKNRFNFYVIVRCVWLRVKYFRRSCWRATTPMYNVGLHDTTHQTLNCDYTDLEQPSPVLLQNVWNIEMWNASINLHLTFQAYPILHKHTMLYTWLLSVACTMLGINWVLNVVHFSFIDRVCSHGTRVTAFWQVIEPARGKSWDTKFHKMVKLFS